MMQSPPPYVPVVEYVLKALEHPPFMYVSKLAACCIMLFLTRENPELLQELCHKWALRFRQDRSKLINYIRNRAVCCVNSPDTSMELENSDKFNNGDEAADATDGENSKDAAQRTDENEEDVFGGRCCCDPDVAVEHLLSILNTLVPMYFSWNWHRADYVIQINKEYEAYVREFILPVCTALAPEDGVDDEEQTPWLLPPHTYLDPSQNTSGFYTPTAGAPPFPLVKTAGVNDPRRSGGGISPSVKNTAVLPGVSSGTPTELQGLGYATTHNHFTNPPSGRRSAERYTGVAANPLPRFSPLHPSNSGGNSNGAPTKSPSQGPLVASTAVTPTTATGANAAQLTSSQVSSTSTVSVPAMSPNVMSAGVFNASAVCGLRFLSLSTYRAALRHNTRGLVTVFHAKYSLRSNEVIEAFQTITAKRLLNPMPTIAVVYAVAEPELSTLYKVSWFPTIVYTPPLNCQVHRKRNVPAAVLAPCHPECEHCRNHIAVAAKRHSKLGRHHHSNSHRRSRQGAKSTGDTTQPQSASSRPLSGSDSLQEMDLAAAATNNSYSSNKGAGAVQYEEEERAKVESPNHFTAAPASRRNSELANAFAAAAAGGSGKRSAAGLAPAALPSQAISADKVGESGAAAAAASASRLSVSASSRPDGSSVSVPSAVSGPLSATAPMAPTPTELLFGISVGETTPMVHTSQTPPRPNGGSVENTSLPSSGDEVAAPAPPTVAAPEPEHHPLQQPLLNLVQQDDHVIYPLRGDLTVPALVEWIGARGASVPRLGKLRDVSMCLKSIRKEERFKRYRELHSAVVTLRRLQGQGQGDFSSGSGSEASSSPNSRTSGAMGGGSSSSIKTGASSQQPDQPLFIFLGGGMAAGKTTAVAALAKSSWWQGHKEQSVVVNADEFKLPLESELSSAEAHKHSTRAAENLLVKAVNQGRSIVLDGTMMWKPFVQQVVNMIRVAHLTLFKQGPGYDPKTKSEQYFLADKKRQPALPSPYKIIFLGITVDVETAVPRGFLRKFSTNRGVPISMQLQSFKMFSENFADYVAMVDETTLFNNNVFVNLEKGELPPVMAECNEETGRKLLIHDEAAFQQFVRQQQINDKADNVTQVYPSSPVTPEFPS